MKVVVLGASGGTGRTLIGELVRRGHEVTGVNRSGAATVPAGVRTVAADLSDPEDAKRATAGAEVVVLAAQPPYHHWVQRWPPLMRNVIEGAMTAGAKVVFVDNLYAYSPADGPISETSPEHATDSKGMLRRDLGRMLLGAHERGELRAAIGRFSDYYGPGSSSSVVHMAGIVPALRGLAPRGLFNLDQPHTFHYLPDVVRAFAVLVERPEADGRVWVLPAAPPITQRELLTLVNRQVGRRRRIGVVRPWMLNLAGLFNPLFRESTSTVVQFDRPWVVDATRFETTFGAFETTPHEEAVAASVAWERDRLRS